MVVGGVVISEVNNLKVKHLSLMYYSLNYEMTCSTMIIVDSNLFVFLDHMNRDSTSINLIFNGMLIPNCD